ncbi:MAG: SEC-C domain-containing protein [Pseudomonadales bacterium]|nr:SEC-C domain-containing protein [Pseudomonadales bacterium]
MKTSPDHPCPCGSEKKYRHCCLLLANNPGADAPADDLDIDTPEALEALLENQDYDSLEDAQQFAEQLMHSRNDRPVDDFHGLSPADIHQLLYSPFESPELVQFPEQLPLDTEAPLLTLLNVLFDEIGSGVKPTAKGNLPLKICRAVCARFAAKHPVYIDLAWPFQDYKINTETDFMPLHTARVTAELAGLLHSYRGKLILTGKAKKLLKDQNKAALYPLILKTYISQFNWSYGDGYEEIPFIQSGFMFSLYLLQIYGGHWHDSNFYTSNYLNAFPMALNEVEATAYREPDEIFKSCYEVRCLQRFMAFCGLAELKPINTRAFKLRATPLLNVAVEFQTRILHGGDVTH